MSLNAFGASRQPRTPSRPLGGHACCRERGGRKGMGHNLPLAVSSATEFDDFTWSWILGPSIGCKPLGFGSYLWFVQSKNTTQCSTHSEWAPVPGCLPVSGRPPRFSAAQKQCMPLHGLGSRLSCSALAKPHVCSNSGLGSLFKLQNCGN